MTAPKPPAGQVRRDEAGTTFVCLGSDRYLRWKVIGPDPENNHGWRADQHVEHCRVVGNVSDLETKER